MGDDEDFWEEEARSEAAMEAAGEAYVEEQARRYIEDNQVELAAEFLESNREQAIEDFRRDRLRQYYDDNPLVADKALGCLNLAKTLLTSLPRASVVFSVSAAEVTFKNVLLRPILSGFVHDEDLAEIIVEGATDKQSNKLNDFLANLLDRFAKFPMKKFKRVGVKATYWEELAIASKIRNKVVHDGDDATPQEAAYAFEIAEYALDTILPFVVAKFDFHVHTPATICRKDDCGFKPAPPKFP